MKPTLRFSPFMNSWVASCGQLRMVGVTPAEAYKRWAAETKIRGIVAANK